MSVSLHYGAAAVSSVSCLGGRAVEGRGLHLDSPPHPPPLPPLVPAPSLSLRGVAHVLCLPGAAPLTASSPVPACPRTPSLLSPGLPLTLLEKLAVT